MDVSEYENIIEAVLFASGEAVRFDEFIKLFMLSREENENLLRKFKERYNNKQSGLEIVITDDYIQLLSRAEYIDYIKNVLKSNIRQNKSLSRPALEVLAIIAYNQPVTKSYTEQVRGVESSYLINSLFEKGFITESGRLDVPGRPVLYSTTNKFLLLFGMENISELPDIEKFNDMVKDIGEI